MHMAKCGLLLPLLRLLFLVAELNEATIILMITVGSYQGLCNIARVFTFDTNKLPLKVSIVGGMAMQGVMYSGRCST